MAKVFGAVFGAGSALVILLYLVLGAYYLYARIERVDHDSGRIADVTTTSDASSSSTASGTFIEIYDPNFVPQNAVIPDAELDCEGPKHSGSNNWFAKNSPCGVLIGGKLAAFIDPAEAKANLAGWHAIQPNKR